MKKELVRKITAVLFFLCSLFVAKEAYDSSKGIIGSTDLASPVDPVGKALIFCAITALAASIWMNKKNVVGSCALGSAVMIIALFVVRAATIKSDAILSPYRYHQFKRTALPTLTVALSFLLLFIAGYLKAGSFVVLCLSAALSASVSVIDFTFGLSLEVLEKVFPFLLALAILFWGISQRKAKLPKLAEGASAGDAISALEKLNDLRLSGDISEQEFAAQKAELMKKL